MRRRDVPLRHERLERVAVAAEREDLLVVGAIDRVVAVQDVRGLPERQAEVAPVERDVAEANRRVARSLTCVSSQPVSG